MYKSSALAAACLGLVSLDMNAQAASVNGTAWDQAGRFQLRARVIGVLPDEDGSGSIAGGPDIDDAVVPELDISYFFSDHIAAELIAATANHDVTWTSAMGHTDLGDVWLLPPTLTLQYHFLPHGQFRPYVGAGLNYTIFYGEDAGAVNDTDYKDNLGYVLQAGADWMLNEHWGVNLDIKRLWLDTDVSINSGAITADVDIDPWIAGAGVTYRF